MLRKRRRLIGHMPSAASSLHYLICCIAWSMSSDASALLISGFGCMPSFLRYAIWSGVALLLSFFAPILPSRLSLAASERERLKLTEGDDLQKGGVR